MIASSSEDPARLAIFTDLTGKALASGAVAVLTEGPIAYVAVPARFGPEKTVVGVATFGWDISGSLARQQAALVTSVLVGAGVSTVLIVALYLFIRTSVTGPLAGLVRTAILAGRNQSDPSGDGRISRCFRAPARRYQCGRRHADRYCGSAAQDLAWRALGDGGNPRRRQ